MVPVGDDQLPMIEQTNEIVHKMNSLFSSPVLRPCQALLSDTGRLPGIDGSAKMSKSLGNTLLLSASEETIHRAVSAMYTDPNHLKISDPGKIEGNVVFTWLDAFHPDKAKVAAMKAHYQQGGLGDRVCKNELETCLQELIAPIRERRATFIADKGMLMELLKKGSERAHEVTQKTLQEVKRGLGLPTLFRIIRHQRCPAAMTQTDSHQSRCHQHWKTPADAASRFQVLPHRQLRCAGVFLN